MKKLIAVLFAVAVIGSLNHIANEIDPRLSLTKTPTAAAATTNTTQSTTTPDLTSTNGAVSASTTGLKDGTFQGDSFDNPYGTVQIATVISQGKITDVKFIQMPGDLGHSAMLSRMSQPLLKQTTIDKQSANIDFVSGATYTSESYQQSLQSALDKARA